MAEKIESVDVTVALLGLFIILAMCIVLGIVMVLQ